MGGFTHLRRQRRCQLQAPLPFLGAHGRRQVVGHEALAAAARAAPGAPLQRGGLPLVATVDVLKDLVGEPRMGAERSI